MSRFVVVLFIFVISCPRPEIKNIPQVEYLKEARRKYLDNPLYAYRIIKDNLSGSNFTEQAELLLSMYIDQREYKKAERLLDSLDSMGWKIKIPEPTLIRILINEQRWDKVIAVTNDSLVKGIAYFQLDSMEQARRYLQAAREPRDYKSLYLAKAYRKSGALDSAFAIIVSIDSISSYLANDYQDLLFEILMETNNVSGAIKELDKLKDASLREYVMLKIYETEKDKANLRKTAWRLIMKYPQSKGAYYALGIVKPATNHEYRLFGKVYYFNKRYDDAFKYFQKSKKDEEVYYYLGKISYDQSLYTNAIKSFCKSKWVEAYYYRARIYEEKNEYKQAIALYDSICLLRGSSRYATRALKRKAYLLEEIGDTLSAVQTFLKVKEKPTQFRAAMQLYRIGKLDDVVRVLKDDSTPGFIYWQVRARERLGQPTDSLKMYLYEHFPFSYYSLLKSGRELEYDTISLESWLSQFSDTAVTFDREDSAHISQAVRYFTLNMVDYAAAELRSIEDASGQDIYYLMSLSNKYGADRTALYYAIKLRNLAEDNNIRKFPLSFIKLLYPVRYLFTIFEYTNNPHLFLALIWQESLFDPGATSVANAQGLMQILPSTGQLIAKDLQVQDYSLYDAETSVKFGTYYYNQVSFDFNLAPLALAAYNAGPARVKKWLAKNPNAEMDEFIELMPYSETQDYVKLVLARQRIYESLYGDYREGLRD